MGDDPVIDDRRRFSVSVCDPAVVLTHARQAGTVRNFGILMLERRANSRTLTFRTGRIIVANDAPDIDCAILETSKRGARILVRNPAEVPQTFVLKVDRTNTIYLCDRVWTTGNRIGLSFLPAPQ